MREGQVGRDINDPNAPIAEQLDSRTPMAVDRRESLARRRRCDPRAQELLGRRARSAVGADVGIELTADADQQRDDREAPRTRYSW